MAEEERDPHRARPAIFLSDVLSCEGTDCLTCCPVRGLTV